MDENDRNELERQAQGKLAEARRLIDEAGELASQGQFRLHFGEIGEFIPRSLVDKDVLRERAIELLKREGMSNGYAKVPDKSIGIGYRFDKVPPTPWAEIPEDRMEAAIEHAIEGLNDDLPWEIREYGLDVADTWWHPSRC